MGKIKVSATVDPERLARAKELTGVESVSRVLDRALEVLIQAQLERAHAEGYVESPQGDDTVSTVDPTVWSELPWAGQ